MSEKEGKSRDRMRRPSKVRKPSRESRRTSRTRADPQNLAQELDEQLKYRWVGQTYYDFLHVWSIL